MQAYQHITLLPSPEIPQHFLREKLFRQVHLALAETKTSGIDGRGKPVEYSEYGLSFPQYDAQLHALGCQLRVFAESKEKLQKLNLPRWLDRLTDYCHYTSIKTVPDQTQHVRFERKQFTTNIERLVKRRAKRKNETLEEVRTYYSGFNVQLTKLPFIHVHSLSKNKRFKLFIDMQYVDYPTEGQFSCYGLSKTATVPWF